MLSAIVIASSMMNRPSCVSVALLLSVLLVCIAAKEDGVNQPTGSETEQKSRFREIYSEPWKLVMHDPCTGDWTNHWTLDGLKAEVSNGNLGMDFSAGPVHRDDSCHAVLWTRESFKGDIRIEYEYTKLDDTDHNVTILYVQATGSGEGDYHKDISRWSGLRQVPSMSFYFNHMNTYHISYAAFGTANSDPENDYIRARRYLPETGNGLQGTELKPDYARTGLFERFVPHKITVIKQQNGLFLYVRNPERELLCHWENDSLPPILEGHIGLRHMCTRSARYLDFRVYIR